MRYIVHPKPIQLRDRRTGTIGDTVAFLDFAERVWFSDERPASTPIRAMRWSKVLDRFYSSRPGDTLTLEDHDWEALRAVVEDPHVAFPSHVAVQLIPFSSAILEAANELAALAAPPVAAS